MKDKALPLLMFVLMKQNGDLKIRDCANGSFQLVCTENNECISPAKDFHTLKFTCGVIAKEGRAFLR